MNHRVRRQSVKKCTPLSNGPSRARAFCGNQGRRARAGGGEVAVRAKLVELLKGQAPMMRYLYITGLKEFSKSGTDEGAIMALSSSARISSFAFDSWQNAKTHFRVYSNSTDIRASA
jgi:hypothetical protein